MSVGAGELLTADDVWFRYGRRKPEVLKGLSTRLSGRVAAVLGPNGAGKSTLLSLITGSRRPSAGALSVVGVDISIGAHRRALQRDLGFVPQSMSIFPGYTVEQFLRYVCWLRRVRADNYDKAISRSIEFTDLGRYRDQKIRTLSGGTRQRVKLAQALVNQPRLLVLDEPSVGLDPDQRAEFLELVVSLSERSPVLLATHLVEDVARVCDSVLVVSDGGVLFSGSTSELADDVTVDGATVERGYRRLVRHRRLDGR